MSPEISLDFLNARRLILPVARTVNLGLVGCGGTGSWLAPSLARISRLLIDKFDKAVNLTFIDPDRVEEKNCFRQNFCQAEIGRNKAESLAFRYGLAWGISIAAIDEPFDGPIRVASDEITILVGCVDNAGARQAIKKAVHTNIPRTCIPRTWWLDCGNHQAAGQVLLGCGCERPEDPFELPGVCSWLPLPSTRHPELLEYQSLEGETTENLSCADMAMLDSQGLAINQRIAAEASDYLVRLLLTKDLRKWGTYIDLESGTCKSKYIIRESSR